MYMESQMQRRFGHAAIIFAGLAFSTAAIAAERQITALSNDWHFLQGDPEGAERADASTQGWRTVSVSHDWAIAGPVSPDAKAGGENGFFPSGVAWYRRDLHIVPAPNRRYFVEFDGIMERSGVWVNGHHVGYRPMGYVSLRYDITRHLRRDGPNVIAVR